MLRCRDISKLVSESMEQKLPWRIRMELRMHLLMCRWCLGFARQVQLLRIALRSHPDRLMEDGQEGDVTLSPQAKERMKSLLGDTRR